MVIITVTVLTTDDGICMCFAQDGQTALMSASLKGHDEIVEQLIKAGALPNRQKKVILLNVPPLTIIHCL